MVSRAGQLTSIRGRAPPRLPDSVHLISVVGIYMKCSSTTVSVQEFLQGAAERYPTDPRSLECAALEPDGTLVLWNGSGQMVEVLPQDQITLLGLLLRRFSNLVLIARSNRTGQEVTLCRTVLKYGQGKLVVEVSTQTGALPLFSVRVEESDTSSKDDDPEIWSRTGTDP